MAALMDNGVTRLTRKLCTKFATLAHTHAASDITSGALAIARGGTNASTAADARTNLGVPSDSSIAYVESVTAKTNHAVGDYFMLGGVLMKATAAIATGEQITASKATPATVQGQIDTLRDSVSGTRKFVDIISSSIVINNGASVDIPQGYTTNLIVLISYWGYDGMRSTYIGMSGSINLPVAASATGIGKVGIDVSTGKITNSSGVKVTIQKMMKLVAN